MRSFLGLACYYKHFIGDYSKHAAPLNRLTRKDTPFIWGEQQREAFAFLKHALASFPCLGTIQRDGQLIVNTDACDEAIDSVLNQVQEGAEKVATGSELEPITLCVVGHACLQVCVGISLEGSVRDSRG